MSNNLCVGDQAEPEQKDLDPDLGSFLDHFLNMPELDNLVQLPERCLCDATDSEQDLIDVLDESSMAVRSSSKPLADSVCHKLSSRPLSKPAMDIGNAGKGGVIDKGGYGHAFGN